MKLLMFYMIFNKINFRTYNTRNEWRFINIIRSNFFLDWRVIIFFKIGHANSNEIQLLREFLSIFTSTLQRFSLET